MEVKAKAELSAPWVRVEGTELTHTAPLQRLEGFWCFCYLSVYLFQAFKKVFVKSLTNHEAN